MVGSFSDGSTRFFGFLYHEGQFTPFDVPSSTATEAAAINDLGQIAGRFYDNISGQAHGFLWSAGQVTTLDVPGSFITRATAINNMGQIVGLFSDGSGSHGFLWSGGRFTTLDVPNSIVTYASGINDAGQIVGYFFDANFGIHGFLATPVPPPLSFAAFTAAASVAFRPDGETTLAVQAHGTLGATSNGIAPLTEPVTLALTEGTAAFTATIPAGSFTQVTPRHVAFVGMIDGVELQVQITQYGHQRFTCQVAGTPAMLAGLADPVVMMLTIGDDHGSTAVHAAVRQDDDDEGAQKE
jgi:probable HAF family extracellular repeat protein